MKRSIILAAGLALAALPGTADAQIFNGTPFAVEYQDFVGGSGVNGTYGVQVGPYTSRFLGSAQTSRSTATPQFSVYCVDYLHYASRSDGLTNVTALDGSLGSLSNTRLNDVGRYQQSAYLASIFDDGAWQAAQTQLNTLYAGSWTFSRSNVWGGLHAAIWDVSTGPSGLGSGATAVARDYFLGLANDNAGSFSLSGWYVLTDLDVMNPNVADGYTGQEFLMRAQTRSVPEPSAILLMVTGLLLLAGVSLGRTRRTQI